MLVSYMAVGISLCFFILAVSVVHRQAVLGLWVLAEPQEISRRAYGLWSACGWA